ncbi:MAG: hypothetical protein QOD07_542 [Frankiaceae bacterium]|nr:hypothetical protein [Frankiaceae bacterium]
MSGARRYLIYGVTGSGKTVLAKRLAERTALPFFLVDDLTWLPGWVPVGEEEQRALIDELTARDAWVVDSAYSKWLDLPLARADVIVALDYPRWVSLWRVTRRSLLRAIDRRPICGGNVETWRRLVSRDSMIHWHFHSFARKRARIRAWVANPPGPQVVLLSSPQQARKWLDSVQPDAPDPL